VQETGYGPAPDNTTIVDTHGFVDQGGGAGTIIGAQPGEGTSGTGSDVTGGLGGNGDAGTSGDLGGSGGLDGISVIGSGPGGPGGPAGPGGFGGLGPSPGGGPREPSGPAYDLGWLRKQLLRYRATHRADIASNIKFANAVDTFATVYTGVTLGPAGIYAGLLGVGEAGIGVYSGAVAGFEAAQTGIPVALGQARYVTAAFYMGVVVPTSSLTVTNPTVHDLIEEIIEEPWKWP
jgi:hypothetical protein